MIYCDTSFLGSLYLPGQKYEPVARAIAQEFVQSIAYPALVELELVNSVYRGVASRIFDTRTSLKILEQIDDDKACGVLSPCLLECKDQFAQALDLTRRFTAIHSLRSLDVLHLAAALLLKASQFASFDLRQRRVAVHLGLKILPEQSSLSG